MELDVLHLLIFGIPGFFIVWSFRKAAKSEKISDFEYLMFSIFWGIILLAVFGYILPKETLSHALSNPYATPLILSPFGVFFSYITGTFYADRALFPVAYKKLKTKLHVIFSKTDRGV